MKYKENFTNLIIKIFTPLDTTPVTLRFYTILLLLNIYIKIFLLRFLIIRFYNNLELL